MKKTKKINYWIESKKDFSDRKLALVLFDKLDFNENIVLYAFRANKNSSQTLEKFSVKVPCKIIHDVTRSDCFCILIPKLQSNLQLYELITTMDVQTEWIYIPKVKEFDQLLFNWQYVQKKDAVAYDFTMFEASFDSVFGLNFIFDLNSYELQSIETKLKDWETQFDDINFTKKMK